MLQQNNIIFGEYHGWTSCLPCGALGALPCSKLLEYQSLLEFVLYVVVLNLFILFGVCVSNLMNYEIQRVVLAYGVKSDGILGIPGDIF